MLLLTQHKKKGQTTNASQSRFFASIEKALMAFESIEEWPDYISVLTKFQKVRPFRIYNMSSSIGTNIASRSFNLPIVSTSFQTV